MKGNPVPLSQRTLPLIPPPPDDGAPPANPVRVVLVEDHRSLREMMADVLRRMGGFVVVGEAAGGVSGLRVCREVEPDVVILDLALPELGGVHVIRYLRAGGGKARVLVYTGTMDEGLMARALAEGPDGFVRKEDSLVELRAALVAVAAGGRHLSPQTMRLRGAREVAGLENLSADEVATVQMISERMQSKEIAEVLGTTPKQVDNIRQRVMTKLGLHDVVSLTHFALRHGLGGR